jgi:hypothetical protein
MTPREADPVVVAGLRAWARGAYGCEAAVEVLARFQHGRFTDPSWEWINHDPTIDWCTLLPDHLTGPATAELSGGERRILRIVASLAGGAPVELDDTLAGLDRSAVALVLAAVAHAAGSHQHTDLAYECDGRPSFVRGVLPPLYAWPAETRIEAF